MSSSGNRSAYGSTGVAGLSAMPARVPSARSSRASRIGACAASTWKVTLRAPTSAYAEVGARNVTFHVEAAHAPIRLARELRALGTRAGMALKPATPVEPYADLLPELDMLLLMTVEPGFGGQPFLDVVLPKVRRAREILRDRELAVWLQ